MRSPLTSYFVIYTKMKFTNVTQQLWRIYSDINKLTTKLTCLTCQRLLRGLDSDNRGRKAGDAAALQQHNIGLKNSKRMCCINLSTSLTHRSAWRCDESFTRAYIQHSTLSIRRETEKFSSLGKTRMKLQLCWICHAVPSSEFGKRCHERTCTVCDYTV